MKYWSKTYLNLFGNDFSIHKAYPVILMMTFTSHKQFEICHESSKLTYSSCWRLHLGHWDSFTFLHYWIPNIKNFILNISIPIPQLSLIKPYKQFTITGKGGNMRPNQFQCHRSKGQGQQNHDLWTFATPWPEWPVLCTVYVFNTFFSNIHCHTFIYTPIFPLTAEQEIHFGPESEMWRTNESDKQLPILHSRIRRDCYTQLRLALTRFWYINLSPNQSEIVIRPELVLLVIY